ncbi:truncated hemoglobin GlbN [Seminavis robusta]|uniref:Truncated hemoglobin GlbN n=1 Tax=Seminavis robusta TaxID=568900 RepID=A0A9N8DIH0_9STRA|nr:truncated hemoglobin GlbN [Seminavis robusta]|eukprot:Sro106_g053600.1 truncated hemoglobin GlbN (174) ;mRNA; f:76248-76769
MALKIFKRWKAKYGVRVFGSKAAKTVMESDERNGNNDSFDNGFLLDRLGGPQVLECLVEAFLDRVLLDDKLMDFFKDTDLRVLTLHQKRFFTMAFTKIPESVNVMISIKNHHKHLFAQGLHEGHFDLVVQHLTAAMEALEVDKAIMTEAARIVLPLRVIFEEGAKEAKLAQDL